jgi:membrane associated rhomboid family serine protease
VIPISDINPTRRRPVVVYALIAANVLVFVYQSTLAPPELEHFVYRWGFVPHFFTQDLYLGSLSTPLTSMFLHGGLLHVGANMWFLYVFGDNVEDVLGRPRFVLFYLGAGLCAAFAHALVEPGSRLPMVGASGAIAGVLGAYFRLFPGARVHAWAIVVVELPALLFIFVWFLWQLISGLGTLGLAASQREGIAFFAHIGGFLAGLWLVSVLQPRASSKPPSRQA